MTDKQIIYRVNVKECKYYCNGKCERYEEFVEADYANYSVKCICEKENDLGAYDICDYQQLKRKEQECEELKAKFELFKSSNQTTIDQLKAENETLFKAIEEVNKINKKLESENEDLKKTILQECPNCGEEYLNYKGAALYFENSDLKQTLTEIKEIAYDGYNNGQSSYATFQCEKIINKINKVEDANNNG